MFGQSNNEILGRGVAGKWFRIGADKWKTN